MTGSRLHTSHIYWYADSRLHALVIQPVFYAAKRGEFLSLLTSYITGRKWKFLTLLLIVPVRSVKLLI
jgi:hypothetical protein